MTPAGWYDDPLTPGGKRYWDGEQWTDQVQAPPVNPVGGPGFGPAQDGPPPFTATPTPLPPGPGAAYVYTGTGLNDLGEWIRRSFSMVFQRFGPLTVFFLIQFAVGAAAYIVLDQGIRGGAITDDGDFLGFNTQLVAISGGLFALAMLVSVVMLLAGHHSLYAGHVGYNAPIGESLSMGLRRTPRFIGVMILVYLAYLVVYAVLVGIAFGMIALLGDSGGGLAVLLFIVGYVGIIAAAFYLSVKLAFIVLGPVIMPTGTSVLGTSWNVSEGYFWPILGRQLLLGLIVGLVGMVVYFVGYILMIGLFFTQFGIDEDGRLLVDGQDIETLSIFEIGDFLPNPILMVVVFGVLFYLVYMIQNVVNSGTSALYADLGGPNIFGHRQR